MDQPKPRLEDLRIEHPPRAGRPVSWVLILILVLVAGATGLGLWSARHPHALLVNTAPAREQGASPTDRTVLNASGYVTARRSATVSSKVTGKVMEVLVEEGQRVQQGQVLARLDDTNIKASLQLAEAQLTSANKALAETQVRIRLAELELKRQADLIRSRISTQADYDRAEADALALKAHLEQQEADVKVAASQLATWQQQLDDTIIRAPYSGIVTSKNAQPGEMISPVSAGGGFTRTGICTIVDMESLEIEVDVSESYINRVEANQPVEAALDAYPDWKIPCKVIAIIPTADRQKSTVRVRVGFDRLDKRILPEMSIKVSFRSSDGGAQPSRRLISVPRSALRKEGERDVLFLVREGRAERRAVAVQAVVGEEALLTSGVSPGENVVLEPPAKLQDGAAVRTAK